MKRGENASLTKWRCFGLSLLAAFIPQLGSAEGKEIPRAALEKYGLRSYLEPGREQLLVEGRNSGDQALFLLGLPYAIVKGRFVKLSSAISRDGESIPDGVAKAYILPFVSEKKREPLLAEAREAKGIQADGEARCNAQRPVQRIFLDPGHGGGDFGTKYGSLYEKDIALKFALLVAKELKSNGFTISFSRSKDVFLPLDIRSELAKVWGADLFLSLHLNSAHTREAYGTETYILSADATDAEARKLALLENSIVQEVKEKESAVQDILWDMEQTTYLQDSAFLASYIQKNIVRTAHKLREKRARDWRNRGVRQAPFFVLSRAAMPAVLVELGYLSNGGDRALLTNKKFQESLAKAVADGVREYREACKAR